MSAAPTANSETETSASAAQSGGTGGDDPETATEESDGITLPAGVIQVIIPCNLLM